MQEIYQIIKENPLFYQFNYNQFEIIFNCLNCQIKKYTKNQTITMFGDPITKIGLIINGVVKISKQDITGNNLTITTLSVNELFGEVFAFTNTEHSPVNIDAINNTTILFIDYQKIITNCNQVCSFHSQLMRNMLTIMAQKNLFLNQKIDIISKPSIRQRLLTFFNIYYPNQKKFNIDYNREQLANYLGVNRSALSKELAKMQKEKILTFNKNSFEFL